MISDNISYFLQREKNKNLAAFVKVCEAVAPRTFFYEIKEEKKIDEQGISFDRTLLGFNAKTNEDIKVSTEILGDKGLHIVVWAKEQGSDEWEIINKVYYFNFNWLGIKATINFKN